MAWLVEAGLHPRARTTTLTVAEDLARRMDYDLGLVLYDLKGTAARCRLTVATVKRHVRVLRELGALAWKRHGTKRNLHLPGRPYTATATIYAATIPAVHDTAKGHRLDGTGYEARVRGVTDTGRGRAITAARTSSRAVNNMPVSNRRSSHREPHSLMPHHNAPRADPSGTSNYTPHQRVTAPGTPTPAIRKAGSKKTTAGRTGRRRKPADGRAPRRGPFQVARDIAVARQVRPLVPWTQHEGLRRLAHALRPLIDRGLDTHAITAELHGMALTWRPRHPAAYITAVLTHDRRTTPEAPDSHNGPDGRQEASGCPGHYDTPPPGVFSQALSALREAQTEVVGEAHATDTGTPGSGVESLTTEEITLLRSAAVADPALVLTALENLGEHHTRRLYTDHLVDEASLQLFGGPHIFVGYRRRPHPLAHIR
ncbi:cell wall protein [Streptomyces sp. NBC_01754]|uniref:cell wall protein n=1 Tax=Streptomyces sp. NBC_01754 TaxID=2975930 RepID=UPI002DD95609|nr:cell wall protein [Streptomyces sp. NBC_01754]WSC92826.1 cell wall protein [Streptomyces sp. NBC_01754]